MKQNLIATIKRIIYQKRYIPYRIFIKKQYFQKTGKKLNLKKPSSFNEKIQWIKTYYRLPLLTKLADKYSVREYVQEKVGDHILNKIYGVFEEFEQININTLPPEFVIKATHGSGWNIICKNKNEMNWNEIKKIIDAWLNDNYYYYGREWAYRKIKPKIIIEKYLEENGKIPLDYKIFCFNGTPTFIQVDLDRFGNHTRIFYDLNWNELPFSLQYSKPSEAIPKPTPLDQMIQIAKKLSEGLIFVRVDLYVVYNKVIFGEMTFYPGNGGERFIPDEYDQIIGTYLKLSI